MKASNLVDVLAGLFCYSPAGSVKTDVASQDDFAFYYVECVYFDFVELEAYFVGPSLRLKRAAVTLLRCRSLKGDNVMGSFTKIAGPVCLTAVSLMGGAYCIAQSAVPVNDIEKQLLQLYQTAKATADGTDIVTAGAVLVLQKDHLLMIQVDQAAPVVNFYKNGQITNGLAGAASFFKTMSKLGAFNPLGGNAAAATASSGAATTREFVAGEKFWVTSIDTRPDGVTFNFLSDPIKDQRYRAILKFPFAKGAAPSPDDVASLVSEVIKIDGSDNSQDQSAATQSAQGSGPAAPAAPKTIALGQTRDQVVAAFGVPAKIVQLGTKEIDFFPDMKVTFVQNKVVDVK